MINIVLINFCQQPYEDLGIHNMENLWFLQIPEWMEVGCIFVGMFQHERLPLNLKADVLSEPVRAWNNARDLQVSSPRFAAVLIKFIILLDFGLHESKSKCQMLGLPRTLICWWFACKMTTIPVSPVWKSPIDFVWRACKRGTIYADICLFVVALPHWSSLTYYASHNNLPWCMALFGPAIVVSMAYWTDNM